MTHDSNITSSSHQGLCSVVIPAYNEEAPLKIYLPEVIEFCDQLDWPVIIVNDGSTDKTQQVIESHSYRLLTLINHKVNRGYGGALKTGLRAAKTEYVVTIDSDGQHQLTDLVGMLDEVLRTDADMIVGNRSDAAHKGSLFRRIGKNIIRSVARMLMHVPIHDLNSGLKMSRTKLVQKFLDLCPDSMAFSDVITLVFLNERCRVLERPIEIVPRIGGESTIGVQTAIETVMEIINIVVLFNPMRVFLPLALTLGVVGFLWGLPCVLRGEGVQTGALLGIISGLIFFLMGLIAEQLSLLRRNLIK